MNKKRELDALAETAGELYCNNLLVISNDKDERIEWKGIEITITSVRHF